MNTKWLFAVTIAAGITAAATMAAPLPAGTLLTIEKTTDATFVGPLPGCTNGSCFGMYLSSGLYVWTPLGPGTDGGLIIGKGQLSGGQEINGLSPNSGELTEVWDFGNNFGTFFTAPSDAGNVFDDQSCTGSGCGSNTTPRKTDLAVWNTAWGGNIAPMGSASGCNPMILPACTADQVAGIFAKTWDIDPAGTVPRKYRLTYNQVVPTGWPNQPIELVLSGTVQQNQPPVVTVTPATLAGPFDVPIPFTITVTDPDGPAAPVCRVGTPPGNGIVTLTSCTGGTYTADIGFVGTGSFTIIANDGLQDSAPATVSIIPETRPTASNVNISGHYGTPLTWTPVVSYAYSCRIATPPNNGVASVASDCSTGRYTANIGFVGTDSFTYIASGFGDSPPATVTAAITAPDTDTGCAAQHPVTQATLTGKQGHLTITVTGNLVSVNPNGKEIKICPTTTATYAASTNTPGATVVCKVKSNTSRGKGNIKVNDHIKCTDKPVGNDKINVKIKSGVYQRVM